MHSSVIPHSLITDPMIICQILIHNSQSAEITTELYTSRAWSVACSTRFTSQSFPFIRALVTVDDEYTGVTPTVSKKCLFPRRLLITLLVFISDYLGFFSFLMEEKKPSTEDKRSSMNIKH